MPDWLSAVLAVITGSVPLIILLLTLHDRTRRARNEAQRKDAKAHKRERKAVAQRFDHIDLNIDDIRDSQRATRERLHLMEGRVLPQPERPEG